MNTTKLLQLSKQFGRYCDRRFAPLCARYGLTMREVHVLLFLANNPDYDTARDITELRGISKSQVSQAVDFMVEMGYLARTADGEDRRVVHLSITEEGRAVAREAQAVQSACGARLLEGLTQAQQDTLQELWSVVLKNGASLAGEVD